MKLYYLLPFTLLACTAEVDEVETPAEATPSPSECLCEEVAINEEENRSYYFASEEWFTGICRTYDDNGQLIEQRDYVDGHVHGKVQEWYPDGQMKSERDFTNNMQNGEFRMWNEDGSLDYAAYYENGAFVKQLERD